MTDRMKRISLMCVSVMVSEEMLEFPAHKRELLRKMKELESYILSVASGKTELWT